jgi:hypothetical protein
MEKKICSKCKEEKEVCEFNKKSISNKGVQYYKSRCKLCQNEDEKIKRDKNPEKYKLWYDKTREERNKWRSEYYKKNKEIILNRNKNYIESRIINSGDFLLLASGGHGFEMLEPTEMIEIKQGPYAGETDKTRFKSIDKDKIKIKN